MNFLELSNLRQSERTYIHDKPVERNKILRCIESARLAPSACNSQPWHFIIVDKPVLKSQVASSMSNTVLPLNHFTNQAPVIIVIVNEGSNFTANLGNKIKQKDFSAIDIGIATEHFCLQAFEEGLGTCILGWFDEKNVKKILHIPKTRRVELLITLGYPKTDTCRNKKRKALDEIFSYNSYK
jgi:nitroreductase